MVVWAMALPTAMRASVPAVTRGRPVETLSEQAADRDIDGTGDRAGTDADNGLVNSAGDDAGGVASSGTNDVREGAAGDGAGEGIAQGPARA